MYDLQFRISAMRIPQFTTKVDTHKRIWNDDDKKPKKTKTDEMWKRKQSINLKRRTDVLNGSSDFIESL